MTTRNIYIFLVATLVMSGCKKYLDVKPKGRLIPATVTDFDHLLDNSQSMEYNFIDNNRGSLLSYLTDNVVISEGQAKVGFILNSHPNIDRYYAHIYRQPYKNPAVNDYFWSSSLSGIYVQISYFNNVLKGIEGVAEKSPADQELANKATAQALTARAWCFFMANLVYGPVYKPGTNNATRTIPYVVSPDINDPIPDLSTSEEVVKSVLADLHKALPDLPAVASWPSRANKATGQAMLAYCHLFTRRYDSVVYYSNLAWTASAGSDPARVLYDFNGFNFSNPNNLVSSPITSSQDPYVNAVNSREILFYRGADNTAGQAPSLSYPSDELIALYDKENDLRFKFFYISAPGYKTTLGGGYNDGTRISNYRYFKVKVSDGFSYPEVLLMRAEGYARTNQLALAIADLNTLRKFRFKAGYTPLTTGTEDQVLQWVLEERRRELPIGGIKRFLDLKRYVLETGKPWSKDKITHTVGGQAYTGTIDSKDFILTIPNTVLQFNPQWGIPLDTRPF